MIGYNNHFPPEVGFRWYKSGFIATIQLEYPLISEEIIQKRKENEERVISFRKSLNDSLYALCEKATGHEWWDTWNDTSYFDVGGTFHRQLSRECRLCRKTETKKE